MTLAKYRLALVRVLSSKQKPVSVEITDQGQVVRIEIG